MPNKKTLADIFEKFSPPRNRQIYSIGYCCHLLDILPGQVCVLMEECGLRFSSMVDDICYITADELQTLIDTHSRIMDEINTAQQSAASN